MDYLCASGFRVGRVRQRGGLRVHKPPRSGTVGSGGNPRTPSCPTHAGSKVIRNGTYGKGLALPRQSYKCFPAAGSKPHKFTRPLPRDHVHENDEHCASRYDRQASTTKTATRSRFVVTTPTTRASAHCPLRQPVGTLRVYPLHGR